MNLHFPSIAACLAASVLGGCASGLARVDEDVDRLLRETNSIVGTTVAPKISGEVADVPAGGSRPWLREQPDTTNPAARELSFTAQAAEDVDSVIARLDSYAVVPEDALRMDLPAALAYAVANSRDYRFAEEEYVLGALRLLIERHRWGPRFFDEVSATASGTGDGGTFDSAPRLVNELGVTQRLPWGGEVSARALADATEDLHKRVAGENVQTAEIILGAEIPLLRGAGYVARESRIQAERNLIYDARDFERFRREFLFAITLDFLGLIVDLQRIENTRLRVASFEGLQAEQEALNRAGRNEAVDVAEAENETLDAIDRLNNDRESYRLNLDRFKVRIGMPVAQPLVIVPDSLGLPTPETDMIESIRAAMAYRLDLQVERDQVDDARRAVENARNALLGDLDLSASFSLPTDSDRDRDGLRFDAGESSFSAGITYGLPLDREIERLNVRQSQVDLARAERSYVQFRDQIALNVRGAARGIDSAQFSLQIQEANVEIAGRRQASIEADPARANVRQKTDAINQLASARDNRDSARRDLEVAVLGYLLATGRLRVDEQGSISPLEGMELGRGDVRQIGDEENADG